MVGSEPALRRFHSYDFSYQYTANEFISKEEYYYQAEHFLTRHHFDSSVQRHIWKMHSQGFALRDIAKEVKLNKDHIALIVNKIKKKMREFILNDGRSVDEERFDHDSRVD